LRLCLRYKKVYNDRDELEAAESRGLEKGEAKGRAEGLAEGKREVALKMLSKKFDDETIVECSGVTLFELSDLKKTLGQ
jgi:predicted transposase/invertase (TIGR01784 family)